MSSNSLLSALDHAGIKYSTRTSPRGIDYAGFIWSTQDGDSTQLTAILEEGVARFTAHTMRVNLAPLTLHDRARKLPWVRPISPLMMGMQNYQWVCLSMIGY